MRNQNLDGTLGGRTVAGAAGHGGASTVWRASAWEDVSEPGTNY
jgi:hypothetical protein